MFGREKCVLVFGEQSILHCGVFRLIEFESLLKCKKTVFAKDLSQLEHRQSACREGWYSLAVMFISHKDFFPLWFSLFLKLNAEANGNLLIFTDGLELMNAERRAILKRFNVLDYVLHPGMAGAYISHIISEKIDKPVLRKSRCSLSCREMRIIDGYVKGMSAAQQASFFNISLKTLYHHRKNCANKLGLRSLKALIHL
ncbi:MULTISPECIES: helix-turn-helix transcriptional regulator [unclassified Pantoea]|uniref:helix-turn-helix transcriptional regulator n=1 Tax=unclassified Pantoea TaxID=2630326 RepID=UPI001CD7B568|nr:MULTISPECIES: LuxR C-terminal-related transcriptional regulator [unclassified Pantoea]MCA1179807.1 LuxR C-terminal-related transcriptional regulator [Pantoea sp. alder69]MCA1253591.1 LuxR C-terminal-related transcriptional regulator [Pantoea sp. alder70]MCA1268293.1 LuxR C-terminal-related transcriptional regulator [Pantoea sp. alder81]